MLTALHYTVSLDCNGQFGGLKTGWGNLLITNSHVSASYTGPLDLGRGFTAREPEHMSGRFTNAGGYRLLLQIRMTLAVYHGTKYIHTCRTLPASALSLSGPGRIRDVRSTSVRSRLTLPERQQAAANARGSVVAEGLDPSAAEVHVDAWTRGEIDCDEMVRRTLADPAARYGEPDRRSAAA
jgi:hypothetical protein